MSCLDIDANGGDIQAMHDSIGLQSSFIQPRGFPMLMCVQNTHGT